MLLLVLEHDIKPERVGRGAAHRHGYGAHVCGEMINVDLEPRKRTFEGLKHNPDDTFDDAALAAILHAATGPLPHVACPPLSGVNDRADVLVIRFLTLHAP
ncbi:hypothetical protein JB92DRAFT_2836732 [Gautieria morchelliformis]|nr:hypothetical protein JB92DRAFT_2836732 [Gautieria morchelliformis]